MPTSYKRGSTLSHPDLPIRVVYRNYEGHSNSQDANIVRESIDSLNKDITRKELPGLLRAN